MSGDTADRALQPAGRSVCSSTFTPPNGLGEPQRTWRCDGTADHAGRFHGGPADDDPNNRAAWPEGQSDAQHPGEPTVVSLRNVYVFLTRVLEQRNQILGAWRQYATAFESLREKAHRQTVITPQEIDAAWRAIPAWARPTAPDDTRDDTGEGAGTGLEAS